MTEQLREQSVSIGRDVAARSTDLILVNDLYALSQLLHDTQTNNPDVRYAFVLDPQGRVLAHTFSSGFPVALASANAVSNADHHHTQPLSSEEGVIWDTAVPIFEGRAGVARVGLSEQRMQATVNAVTGQLLLTTALVSLFGVAAAVFLTWILTRPILSLVEMTQAVGRGDLNQTAPHWADDELGALGDAFNAMTASLAQAERERAEREQMRAYYLSQIIAAQEEERKRVARELHDETGQALTSLMVGLRNVEEARTPEEAHQRLAELRELTAGTLRSVHDLSLELRPSVLDDLGLAAALKRYVQDYASRFRLNVDFQAVGLDGERLSPAVETALYRIVQEALTNVAKYAHARQVSVLLERRANQIVAIVEDDGCGFDAAALLRSSGGENKLGLYGMSERAALVGGTLTIESQPGAGTTVHVRVPLNGQSD
jgi:signal transduction histidine kinase